MRCTSPLLAFYQPGKKLIFAGPSSEFYQHYTKGTSANFNQQKADRYGPYDPIKIPCGKCLACRINRSSQWALRCQHEKFYYKRAAFITLTYSPAYVPPELVKSDLQNFLKRLRKHFSNVKIRYFACGEYGSKLQRPHYHAVLFGVDFAEDRFLWRKSIFGKSVLYRSPTLEKLWPYGFSTIGEVTFESAAYVARYCTKKIFGKDAEAHYGDKQREFQLQSLKPGIGYQFYKEYGKDFFGRGYCLSYKNSKIPIPRYYRKLFELDNPKLFAAFKERAQTYGKELERQRLAQIRDSFEQTDISKLQQASDVYDIIAKELEPTPENSGKFSEIFRRLYDDEQDFLDFVKDYDETELTREEAYNVAHFERTQNAIDDFLGEKTDD